MMSMDTYNSGMVTFEERKDGLLRKGSKLKVANVGRNKKIDFTQVYVFANALFIYLFRG